MSTNKTEGSRIPHSRPQLGAGERLAILATLDRSWVGAGGEATRELEAALAKSFGRPAAVAVSSGSAALEIALRVAGVTGELVAIPAFACGSIERAVVRSGGRPYLVDIDPSDLSFPPGTLRSLADRCKAAILVHQFGVPAAAAAEAAEGPMTIIEDVTTCIGGSLMERPVGSFGRLVVMSFSATKMLCGGEGGAVVGCVSDIEMARKWADPESDLPIDAPVVHAKMSDMACALASVQLGRLQEFLSRRAEIARLYDEVLGSEAHRVVRAPSGRSGTWWRYLIAAPDEATSVVARGLAGGIDFCQPVPNRAWEGRGDFPVADRMHHHLVSVPIYPSLTEREIEHVRRALRTIGGSR